MWGAHSLVLYSVHFTFLMHGRACIIVINIEVWSRPQTRVCLWRRHIRKLWWVSSDQGREAAVQTNPLRLAARRQLRAAQRAAGTHPSDCPTLLDPGSKPQQHQKLPFLTQISCMLLRRPWKESYSVIPLQRARCEPLFGFSESQARSALR